MKLKTFIFMPIKDKLMFFANFFLCGLARSSILLFDYKKISQFFGYYNKIFSASIMASENQIIRAEYIKHSIRLVARYTPWNSNCLTQAMVAVFWCKYYKIPYLLFIGIAKKSQKPLGQDAHAWITCGPVAITGAQSFSDYQVIYTYSNYISPRESYETNPCR